MATRSPLAWSKCPASSTRAAIQTPRLIGAQRFARSSGKPSSPHGWGFPQPAPSPGPEEGAVERGGEAVVGNPRFPPADRRLHALPPLVREVRHFVQPEECAARLVAELQ